MFVCVFVRFSVCFVMGVRAFTCVYYGVCLCVCLFVLFLCLGVFVFGGFVCVYVCEF